MYTFLTLKLSHGVNWPMDAKSSGKTKPTFAMFVRYLVCYLLSAVMFYLLFVPRADLLVPILEHSVFQVVESWSNPCHHLMSWAYHLIPWYHHYQYQHKKVQLMSRIYLVHHYEGCVVEQAQPEDHLWIHTPVTFANDTKFNHYVTY